MGTFTLICLILIVVGWGGAYGLFFSNDIKDAWKGRSRRRSERQQAAELARKEREEQTSAWMKAYEAKQDSTRAAKSARQ
jgi:hypothetical protein